ncbi:hypothetical protein [Microbulbifer spongiae]|uniref:Uncharacterized protein n=1 Tax=Microbulbifer spongiae TaxID=2944933 RepID=A0ABY9E969_9GAMM|nr:hypothetical protein [Microbulbifer sp. MI-G]WKD48667.1 hypothetical protein M8T91_12165 [Microbulbifer sp. MI-G]
MQWLHLLLLIIVTQKNLYLEERITAREKALAFLLKLGHNASVLEECGEDELHRTTCRLAHCWDGDEITFTSHDDIVSNFEVVSRGRQKRRAGPVTVFVGDEIHIFTF